MKENNPGNCVLPSRKGEIRFTSGESEKGFSLIELMVAIVLLTLGLLPLFGVFISASSFVSEEGRHTRAVVLAQDKIEEARGILFGDLSSGEDTVGIFNRVWELEDPYVFDGTTYDEIKRMAITVTWIEEGETHQVDWSSLFSETSE
ncbi:prepilin-type N-terminal cleavage/methylation domain-containing protein [candidate division TA06 bacterium]|nr:prepilin-type N-terminal cleavage/methylation domain-containing protein [candidate division TA06 bacterium]